MELEKTFKISEDGKKDIKIAVGLIIIVFIHILGYLLTITLIEGTELSSSTIAVLVVGFGDIIALTIVIVRRIFNIQSGDLDQIKIDDIPKKVPV